MADHAPTGTLTFLFTDIEGSTRLWDRYPDAMSAAMRMHDTLLDDIAERHGGYVFSKAGDGWGMAFASPVAAIDAAIDVQVATRSQAWPAPIDGIAIREGLHTGTATERNGDYFGTAVNRAARVSSAAAGGQIFVTDTVRLLATDAAPPSWNFRDLGEHRLRDLVRPERLWQVDTADTPAQPASLARERMAGNLPPLRTSVLGRTEEVEEVCRLVENNRLVTLVGVGGVGKTTLAQMTAHHIGMDYEGGAWFVDLTSLDDPDALIGAAATMLDVTLRSEMTVLDSVYDVLRASPRLIIIDNAEHIIDPVTDFVDGILENVDRVNLIVTSREALTVGEETVHRVGPLGYDDELGHAPAVELFVDRARRVAPDLLDGDLDEGTVREICRRLDGLPLAIELAASQCEMMTPAEIVRALDTHELDLHSSARSTARRHRSIASLVGWSYDMLPPNDQAVFRRLAVFRGGCTIAAARSVCATSDLLTDEDAAESIRTLIRKSMVIPERHRGVTRIRQLETIRSFAADRLAETGELDATEARHAAWYAAIASEAADSIVGPDETRTLRGLLDDLDNLRQALSWASKHDAYDVIDDVGVIIPQLVESQMRPEMRTWILEALDALPPDSPARLHYAFAAGLMTIFAGRIAEGPSVFTAATGDVTDRERRGLFESYLTEVSAFFLGDMDYVIAHSEATMAEAQRLGLTRWGMAIGTDLALALHYSGDDAEATRVLHDVIDSAEHIAGPTQLGWAGYVRGEILAGSDPVRAIEHLEEAVEQTITVDNEFVAGICLIALSSIAGRNDDFATALDAMHRCIRLWRGAGNRPQMWTAVRNLVEILDALERYEDALTLHYAVDADQEHAPQLFGPYGEHYLAIVSKIEEGLDADRTETARARGRSLGYSGTAEAAVAMIGSAQSALE